MKYFLEQDRNVQWRGALLLTILFHIVFFLCVPNELGKVVLGDELTKSNKASRGGEVEFIPSKPKEKSIDSMRFVETNSEVASNQPDHTDNFAARNQQAAQEIPVLKDTGIPQVAGKEESQKIVNTETFEENKESQSGAIFSSNRAESKKQETPNQAQKTGLIPLIASIPDKLQKEKCETEGNGIDIEKNEKTSSPSKVVSVNAIHAANTSALEESVEDLPKARPRINRGIMASLMNSEKFGVSRRGRIAIDAQFSKYGEYIQRLLEAVSSNLNKFGTRFDLSNDREMFVTVNFIIDFHGNIKDLKIVNSTASETATIVSKDCVLCLDPFTPWSRDMQDLLGDEKPVRITFKF